MKSYTRVENDGGVCNLIFIRSFVRSAKNEDCALVSNSAAAAAVPSAPNQSLSIILLDARECEKPFY